jgi:hypothetical protein
MQGRPGSMSMTFDRNQPSQHAVQEPHCLFDIPRLSANGPGNKSRKA